MSGTRFLIQLPSLLSAAGLAIANLSLATSEPRKDKESGEKVEKTEWHRVVFFGKLAEIVNEYVKKGSQIYVEGKLSTSSYEKDGVKHYSTQVIGEVMQMLGTHKEPEKAREPAGGGARGTNDFDGDVPFAPVRSYP